MTYSWTNVKVAIEDNSEFECNQPYTHACQMCVVYIKRGCSVEICQEIYAEFYELGWKQIFIPKNIRNAMLAFAPVSHTHLKEIHPCKVCGSIFHSMLRCPDLVCGICQNKGHTPRLCLDAICSRCGNKGHIYKFCKVPFSKIKHTKVWAGEEKKRRHFKRK